MNRFTLPEEPPNEIKELSGWIATTVHQSLRSAGHNVGNYAVCVVSFKAREDGFLEDAIVKIKFMHGQKPKPFNFGKEKEDGGTIT